MLTNAMSHDSAMTTAPMVASVAGATRTTWVPQAISSTASAPISRRNHQRTTRLEFLFMPDIVAPAGRARHRARYSIFARHAYLVAGYPGRRGGGRGPQPAGQERGPGGAGQERGVVAAVERGQVPLPGGEQAAGAGGGEAGQDGQPERAAEHEGGV